MDEKNYILARAVHADYNTGCGDTCDLELDQAVKSCTDATGLPYYDPAFVACLATLFDSDCIDCLCDYYYDRVGVPCPFIWIVKTEKKEINVS